MQWTTFICDERCSNVTVFSFLFNLTTFEMMYTPKNVLTHNINFHITMTNLHMSKKKTSVTIINIYSCNLSISLVILENVHLLLLLLLLILLLILLLLQTLLSYHVSISLVILENEHRIPDDVTQNIMFS